MLEEVRVALNAHRDDKRVELDVKEGLTPGDPTLRCQGFKNHLFIIIIIEHKVV